MIASVVLVLILTAKFFPDLPVGRWLNQTFVEAPLRWASGLSARKVALFVIMLAAFAAFSASLPFDLALLMAVDTTTYLEVFAAVSATALLVRTREARNGLKNLAANWLRSAVMSARPVARRARRAFRIAVRKVLGEPGSDAADSPDAVFASAFI